MRSCYHSLLLMPAKNMQFLPRETSKFCIETSVCPVVTKLSKTMMLRSGGMLLALKTVPTRCFEGAKAQKSLSKSLSNALIFKCLHSIQLQKNRPFATKLREALQRDGKI